MNSLVMGLRDFRRDFRNTDFRLLALALMIAVLAVTSVGFFTDRVNRAIRSQATALLGADVMIESTRTLDGRFTELFKDDTIRKVRVTEFASVVFAADSSQLAQVKVVGQGYPLRGNLELQSQRGATVTLADSIPEAGSAWVEERILTQLNLKTGDTVNLGNSELVIRQIITFEPDRGGSAFQLAPRVMISAEDLEATGLLTAASRASHRLLLSSDNRDIDTLAAQFRQQLQPWEHLQTIDEGRPEISSAIARAARFMGLASIVTVILAGAAIALSARSFSQREIGRVAILRSLGAVKQQLWINYALRLLIVLIMAVIVGSVLGYFAQYGISKILGDWIHVRLPPTRAVSLFTGVGTAIITLAGFALPPILRLLKTPPMRILRSEMAPPKVSIWMTLIFMASSLFLLVLWQSHDWLLTTRVFAGLVAGLVIIFFCAWLLLSVLRKVSPGRSSAWRLGIHTMSRFASRSTVLISAFAVAFLALNLLSGVRGDLLQAWQNNIPEDAPNYFLINIQPDETLPMDSFLKQRDINNYTLYPMARGRLVSINGREVKEDDYTVRRAKQLINHEFNLSSSIQLPAANTIVEGEWFSDQGLSIEKEVGKVLGFGLNDTLTFDVAGQIFTDTVTSVREVEWDSMKPNFFILTSDKDMRVLPKTYMTSLMVEKTDTTFSTELVKQFPSVTSLDLNAIITQVRRIMDQASKAIEYVFLFTLLAGVVVLITAIQTQKAERSQEIALLKSWGASYKQIRQAVFTEFAVIGALAGFLGSALALFIGWLLAEQVFKLPYSISWDLLLYSIVIGTLCIGTAGLVIVHNMIKTRPIALLQHA